MNAGAYGRQMSDIVTKTEYIDLEDSVRIGDDLNDISMFFDKGLNVAVENAMPELKNKAHFITKSCENDGVAFTIKRVMSDKI